jgi:hypothetical protein
MPFFDWFSRKKPGPPPPVDRESSGLGHVDATVPFAATPSGRGRTSSGSPGSAANRKTERLERREQLYAIVRESMTRAGVLSSSYKFKVLSLDSRGRQYLIMMDLPRQHATETGRLAEIEGLIAKSAKTRFDIVVTAVYWRVNEQVTAGLTRSRAAASTVTVAAASPAPQAAPGLVIAPSVTAPVATEAAPVPAKPRFDPLQDDEVAAFKKALASVPVKTTHPAAGVEQRSGRRNPSPEPPQFRDTELDESPSPLSGTQYGDLN